MLTTSLPLLPPPASSLLPALYDSRNSESANANDGPHSLQAQQQQQRRRGQPHTMQPRSQLALLAHDERMIVQRKLAIQMFGYSWLKPAGCHKTMLGRREEELEREEVEKQLRDAELQERNQFEMEEAQRQAQLEEQRTREARGEDIGEEGERDLDEDVPDAEVTGDLDDGDSLEDDEVVSEEGDLDDEIPEADGGWAFDTTRNSDTMSETSVPPSSAINSRPRPNLVSQPSQLSTQRSMGDPVRSPYGIEEFDEDYDLDDELPDMDGEDEARDLDDEVPDADQDDEGWEHTDTELEESEMDISIMPPGVTAHSGMPSLIASTGQRQRRRDLRQSEVSDAGSSMRRTSGNIPLPMQPPARAVPGRGVSLAHQLTPNFAPGQLGSDFSVSALISTGNTDMTSEVAMQTQRTWLDPASARRNLFGIGRNDLVPPPAPVRSGLNQSSRPVAGIVSGRNQAQRSPSDAPRQVSSGGLFTPSPQQQNIQGQPTGTSFDESQSRTRSGRVIGRSRGGRA